MPARLPPARDEEGECRDGGHRGEDPERGAGAEFVVPRGLDHGGGDAVDVLAAAGRVRVSIPCVRHPLHLGVVVALHAVPDDAGEGAGVDAAAVPIPTIAALIYVDTHCTPDNRTAESNAIATGIII